MRLDILKGKLVEKKVTYTDCSDALNISITAFSNKMNKKSKFTVEEANELSNFLKFSNDEKLKIFLE